MGRDLEVESQLTTLVLSGSIDLHETPPHSPAPDLQLRAFRKVVLSGLCQATVPRR